MNWKFWQEKDSIYDEPIKKVLVEMEQYSPNDEEWPQLVATLDRLNDSKAKQSWKMKVSPDTIAIVGGNLLGILLIVAYEQKHPMVSKGMNYIKPQT